MAKKLIFFKQNLQVLQKLDLSNNQIRQLHPTSFKNNMMLIDLQLWKNQLEDLSDDIFMLVYNFLIFVYFIKSI